MKRTEYQSQALVDAPHKQFLEREREEEEEEMVKKQSTKNLREIHVDTPFTAYINISMYKKRKKERKGGRKAYVYICACIPSTAKLIELAAAREDDESNLSITKHRKFIGLLEQTISAFGEGNLTVDLVLYPLQLHSSSPHSLSLSLHHSE